MRAVVLNKLMNFVDNGKYSNDDLEKIKYGFECIYILITKGIVIFSIAYLLEILKYTLCFTFFFGLLRMFACGMHASKSLTCLIISTALFLIIPYLCKLLVINSFIKIATMILFTFFIIIYSPADTKKRPIISKKRRYKLKIISSIISLLYIIAGVLVKNEIISNTIMFAIVLESIMILPVTYKAFKLPYNNYINYVKSNNIERRI